MAYRVIYQAASQCCQVRRHGLPRPMTLVNLPRVLLLISADVVMMGIHFENILLLGNFTPRKTLLILQIEAKRREKGRRKLARNETKMAGIFFFFKDACTGGHA